jgi:hypothetical protein
LGCACRSLAHLSLSWGKHRRTGRHVSGVPDVRYPVSGAGNLSDQGASLGAIAHPGASLVVPGVWDCSLGYDGMCLRNDHGKILGTRIGQQLFLRDHRQRFCLHRRSGHFCTLLSQTKSCGAVEHYDPVERWTGRCPMPIVSLVVLFGSTFVVALAVLQGSRQ